MEANNLNKLIKSLRETIKFSYDGLFTCEYSKKSHLNFMLNELEDNIEKWDSDKINRWIGYIQGVLVTRKISTLESERDRVRKNLN